MTKKLFCAFLVILSLGTAIAAVGCGDQGDDPTNQTCNHEYSAWEAVGDPATCTTGGTEKRTCSKCGNEDTRPVDPIGHKWSKEKQIVEQANCKQTGKKAIVCERCGETKDEEIIPISGEHEYGEWTITKPATCEEPGSREKVCPKCNDKVVEEIKATGHNFDDPEPETTEAATCTDDGTLTLHCQNENCTKTKEEKIQKLGHTWVDTDERTEPTCTEKGSVKQRCSVCETEQNKELPANGHTIEREVKTAATCTTDGTEIVKCTVCTKSEEAVVKQLGHDMETFYRVDEEPTESKDGKQSHHCTRCDHKEDEKSIAKSDKLKYMIDLSRTNGASAAEIFGLEILDSTGKSVQSVVGNSLSAELPLGDYTAKISALGVGYSVDQEEIKLTPKSPRAEFVLKTEMQKPNSTLGSYKEGDVMRDHPIHIVGATEEEDVDTSIGELLKKYKAIFMNLYFTTCAPCMGEIQEMIDAYNATSSTGKIYGEEVAMIMLPIGETVETVRRFKNLPKAYSTLVKSPNLPFMMAHQDDLMEHVSTGGFPTTYIIDCEGVITLQNRTPMNESLFVSAMEDYGLKNYFNLHPKKENYVFADEKKENALPEAILPERREVA